MNVGYRKTKKQKIATAHIRHVKRTVKQARAEESLGNSDPCHYTGYGLTYGLILRGVKVAAGEAC